MSILDQLLFGPPQLSAAGFFVVLLGLSLAIGYFLDRGGVEGMVWGFLILAASSDLALFLSREITIATSRFGWVVAAIAGLMIVVFRTQFFKTKPEHENSGWFYPAMLVAFAVIIWSGNIFRPLPDAGFSSHHGWVPLYVQESFLSGRFLEIRDMAFGQGVATSLFYPADLLGLTALARWLGWDVVYPAFNAGSITATVLLFWILSRSLRTRPLSLLIFFVLSLLYFATDRLFQITLGGNWGDVVMYLGGGLMAYYLVSGKPVGRALIMAALASTFLVFARHYGAFYGALMIGGGFVISGLVDKKISWRPWVLVGLTWLVFSFRELYYLFGKFTVYYPGSWQAERMGKTSYELFSGALTDWGLITASDLSLSSLSLRGIYVLVLLTALWMLHKRGQLNKARLFVLLAPLALFAMALMLQTVTGFRTNALYSKLYIVGIFIPAWYPAFIVSTMIAADQENKIWQRCQKTIFAAIIIFVLVGGAGLFMTNAYQRITASVTGNDIVDRDMAATLKRELSPEGFKRVVDKPVMYFLYEPGASLRLYLGGRFFNDLDFWSERVLELARTSDRFEDVLKALDYPNLYISMMGSGKISPFIMDARQKFFKEIENPDQAPWLKRLVKSGDARFYITGPSNE